MRAEKGHGASSCAHLSSGLRVWREREVDLDTCLISVIAGGVGLNLFGANRVVILDQWFNPMVEQQAIGRAYRIGQRKKVFVYRLVMAGTFERAFVDDASRMLVILRNRAAGRLSDLSVER